MRWQQIKKLSAPQFKRIVGVRLASYIKMVEQAKQRAPKSTHKRAGKKRGPKPKLNWYDKVLMMLMYYREYRTFAHIACSYNISEAQCWRIITWLEGELIKSKLFRLPGKKKLVESNIEWKAVIIDVSEHSIERPKKSKDNIIQARKRNIH